MTIQEAIKSGKPFRRRDWVTTGQVATDIWFEADKPYLDEMNLELDDILADDWEVKEEKSRLKAWVTRSEQLVLTTDDREAIPTDWTRAPWLDEPEGE